MRTAFVAACVVGVLGELPSGKALAEQGVPALTVTAHQDLGLSMKHAWTVQLAGVALTVERPGKPRRARQASGAEVEALLEAIRSADFHTIPAHLGASGPCDDCERCRVVVDTGTGPHKVERVAPVEREDARALSSEDRRFRALWGAIKTFAGLAGVPDACW